MEVHDDQNSRVSFLLYKDFFNSIEHFSDEELGRLFRLLHLYQKSENWTDADEKTIHPSIKVAFNFYRNQFILDDKKYEKRLIANRINALKGGRPKKGVGKNPKNPMGKTGKGNTHSEDSVAKKPETVTETETVTVTETETENDLDNMKRIKQRETIELVIVDLNERLKLKRGFSWKSESNCNKIIARINEGFTLEDFILVNKKKCQQWIGDPEMAKFLRPETLYGNKFEGYLHELEIKVINPVKPKYQTADERRREHNKKCFNETLQEIDNVDRTGTADNREGIVAEKAEGNSGFFEQLRRELPQGNITGTEPDMGRKFKSS